MSTRSKTSVRASVEGADGVADTLILHCLHRTDNGYGIFEIEALGYPATTTTTTTENLECTIAMDDVACKEAELVKAQDVQKQACPAEETEALTSKGAFLMAMFGPSLSYLAVAALSAAVTWAVSSHYHCRAPLREQLLL